MANTTFKDIAKEILDIIDNPESRKRILEQAGKALKLLVEIYPAPGPWNREPGTRGDGRWYERGYGSRWRRANGTLGGANTSEQLNRSWMVKNDNDKSTSVYTGVSYAPYLFDPEKRVSWARGHGWLDINETAEEFDESFEKIITVEIEKELEK